MAKEMRAENAESGRRNGSGHESSGVVRKSQGASAGENRRTSGRGSLLSWSGTEQATWLKAVREASGLRQADCSRALSVASSQYWQWESGRVQMGGGFCQLFCDACGVGPATREVVSKICGGVTVSGELVQRYDAEQAEPEPTADPTL